MHPNLCEAYLQNMQPCSDRLGRRSSRSITSLQQGRSGRLGRAYGAYSHANMQQPIPQSAASAVNNRTCGSIGCCIGCCLFQRKESLYLLNTQQPIQQPMPLEVLQIMGDQLTRGIGCRAWTTTNTPFELICHYLQHFEGHWLLYWLLRI